MSRPPSPATRGAAVLMQRLASVPAPGPQLRRVVGAPAAPAVPLPDYVAAALARWRLLHDLPFRYLVTDAGLLPPESMRLFRLDDAWLDALAEGALQAGGAGSRENANALAARDQARTLAQAGLRHVRDVQRGRLVIGMPGVPAGPGGGPAAPASLTGLLLRSELIVNWPGLKLRAWASAAVADVPLGADPAAIAAAHPELVVDILRLELLNPSVLIAVFAQRPRMLWLEEPHHAVQFGVDRNAAGAPVLPLRDAAGAATGATQAVPLRAGAVAGVIDVAALAQAIDAALPMNHARGSAALAEQLLRAPARQRFGQ